MTEPVPTASVNLQELAKLAPKAFAYVRAITGGRFVTRRLAMLGVRPGVKLHLVHGPGLHGVVVMAGGARIALGRGVIEHILVELVSGPHEAAGAYA